MRSKEVEEKIHMLKSYVGMTHKLTDNQGRPKLDQAIETLLAYIEELEKDVKDAMDGYQDLGKEVYFNFISKDKIKDKIKELENMRDTSITSEAFNIFNGEIIVLQELLEGEK